MGSTELCYRRAWAGPSPRQHQRPGILSETVPRSLSSTSCTVQSPATASPRQLAAEQGVRPLTAEVLHRLGNEGNPPKVLIFWHSNKAEGLRFLFLALSGVHSSAPVN